jgi:hypothetical protein
VKVYITKYALTRGIMVVDAEQSDIYPEMIDFRMPASEGAYKTYAHKPDWWTTWAEAEHRAFILLNAKIESHEKAIKRLKAMKFKEPK